MCHGLKKLRKGGVARVSRFLGKLQELRDNLCPLYWNFTWDMYLMRQIVLKKPCTRSKTSVLRGDVEAVASKLVAQKILRCIFLGFTEHGSASCVVASTRFPPKPHPACP